MGREVNDIKKAKDKKIFGLMRNVSQHQDAALTIVTTVTISLHFVEQRLPETLHTNQTEQECSV